MTELSTSENIEYYAESAAVEIYGENVIETLKILAPKMDIKIKELLEVIVFYPEFATQDIAANDSKYLCFRIENGILYFRINLKDYLIKLGSNNEYGYGFYNHNSNDKKEFVNADDIDAVVESVNEIDADFSRMKLIILSKHEELMQISNQIGEISNHFDGNKRFKRVGEKTTNSGEEDGDYKVILYSAEKLTDDSAPSIQAINLLTKTGLIELKTRVLTELGKSKIIYSINHDGLVVEINGEDYIGNNAVNFLKTRIDTNLRGLRNAQ